MKFFSREFRELARNSIEIRVIRGPLISKHVSLAGIEMCLTSCKGYTKFARLCLTAQSLENGRLLAV